MLAIVSNASQIRNAIWIFFKKIIRAKMPVFDYECKNCGKRFEELVLSATVSDTEVECPGCGQQEAIRKMSAPSIGGSGSSSASHSGGCGSSGFS